MRSLASVVSALLVVGASAALSFADKVPNESNDPDSPGTCPVDGYKFLTDPTDYPIPDGPTGSVTTGPLILLDDGDMIADVVVSLTIAHTWIGDLVVHLFYDPDCGGPAPPLGPVALMCRQGLPGCPIGPDPAGFGCSADLTTAAPYVFGLAGTKPIAEPGAQCSATIAAGCYDAAADSPFAFGVFDGRKKGGCWYLTLIDAEPFDTGTLFSWTIYVLNEDQPVPVEASTWGGIKAAYQD